MAGRGSGPDFVESLARGLDILACFGTDHRTMTLTEVATAAEPGPADRAAVAADPGGARLRHLVERLLRADAEGARPRHRLRQRPRAVGHRAAAHGAAGRARPVSRRRWPSSTAPTSSTSRGSRCRRSSRCGSRSAPGSRRCRPPRARCCSPRSRPTSWSGPSSSRAAPACRATSAAAGAQLDDELVEVRARGWALADEELAPGVRSVAVPVRDGTGAVRAAMNVTVHAAETTTDHLLAAPPAPAAAQRRRRQCRVGPLAGAAARRGGPTSGGLRADGFPGDRGTRVRHAN